MLAAVLTGAALLCWARAGLAMLSAALSVVLTIMVCQINAGWMHHLDTSVEGWLRPHRPADLQALCIQLFGYIGEPAYFAAAVMVSGTLLALRARSAVPAGVLVGAVGVGVLAEHLLKAGVGRTTTTVAALQDQPNTPAAMLNYLHSFPSGHVTGTAAFFGIVAACLGAGRGPGVRLRLAAAASAGVLLVAVLAVYSRAHTVTDVLGGMVLGGMVTAAAAAVLAAATQRDMAARRRSAAIRYTPDVRTAALPRRGERLAVGTAVS